MNVIVVYLSGQLYAISQPNKYPVAVGFTTHYRHPQSSDSYSHVGAVVDVWDGCGDGGDGGNSTQNI